MVAYVGVIVVVRSVLVMCSDVIVGEKFIMVVGVGVLVICLAGTVMVVSVALHGGKVGISELQT